MDESPRSHEDYFAGGRAPAGWERFYRYFHQGIPADVPLPPDGRYASHKPRRLPHVDD